MGQCIISADWVTEQRGWRELDPCSSSGASPPGPATLLPFFGSQEKISKESKDISEEFRQGYNWERKAHYKWVRKTNCIAGAFRLALFRNMHRSGEVVLALVSSFCGLTFFLVSRCLDGCRLHSDPWGDPIFCLNGSQEDRLRGLYHQQGILVQPKWEVQHFPDATGASFEEGHSQAKARHTKKPDSRAPWCLFQCGLCSKTGLIDSSSSTFGGMRTMSHLGRGMW